LSEKTIEGHRSRMMKRLGIVSVAELVRLALVAGAVSGEGEH
jgi:DNA-binding CsgD family transcriptional regulator